MEVAAAGKAAVVAAACMALVVAAACIMHDCDGGGCSKGLVPILYANFRQGWHRTCNSDHKTQRS
jgi:hypothetical protein